MSISAIRISTEGPFEKTLEAVIEAAKTAGLGIMTRIDFDQKIKEKLNHTLPRTVILGACNPKLALELYSQSTDAALIMPCNIIVRENQQKVLVEAIRPTAMYSLLSAEPRTKAAEDLDLKLEAALSGLGVRF